MRWQLDEMSHRYTSHHLSISRKDLQGTLLQLGYYGGSWDALVLVRASCLFCSEAQCIAVSLCWGRTAYNLVLPFTSGLLYPRADGCSCSPSKMILSAWNIPIEQHTPTATLPKGRRRTEWHSHVCTSSAKWGDRVSILHLPCSGGVTPTQWAVQGSLHERTCQTLSKESCESLTFLCTPKSRLHLPLVRLLVLVPSSQVPHLGSICLCLLIAN